MLRLQHERNTVVIQREKCTSKLTPLLKTRKLLPTSVISLSVLFCSNTNTETVSNGISQQHKVNRQAMSNTCCEVREIGSHLADDSGQDLSDARIGDCVDLHSRVGRSRGQRTR